MSRPRKPTETLNQQGAFLKNPQRTRSDPKTAGPLGAPPKSLPAEAHAIWAELAAEAPLGVLTCADRAMFANLVWLQYQLRQHMAGGGGWKGWQQSALNWLYSHCGMTPSDRSKVNAVSEDGPTDPGAKYFN